MSATATATGSGVGLFTLNAEKVLEGIEGVKQGLDLVLQMVTKEAVQGTQDFAGLVIFEAQQRVPKRSEDLKDSAVIQEPRQDDLGVFTRAGFDKIYAHIQDAGGTIRPVRADALAIPMPAIRDANGKSKYANPRQEPTLFVVRIHNIGYLAKKVGTGLELHWRFAHEVVIKGNRYLSGVIEDQKSKMPEFFGNRIKGRLVGGTLR